MFDKDSLIRVSCNLCGRNKTKFITTRPDGLKVVECLNCGLAYLNPRPRGGVIFGLYDENYYQGRTQLKSYDNYIEETLKSLEDGTNAGFQIIKRIATYKELKDSRLLDIGCACGAFLVIARSWKAKVEGLEISNFSAEWGRESFGLEIKTGTLETIRYSANSFDLVTMFDLVEHLTDPTSFFRDVYRITKNGGLICVVTPNYHCKEKYGKSWIGFNMSLEHIYFFDKESLGKMLDKVGFKILHIETMETLSAIQKSVYFKQDLNKAFSKLRNILTKMPPIFYLARYFWRAYNSFLGKINEKTGFGHGLLVIAKK